eukprot:660553-Rhodomonas_salina.1
MLAMLLPTPNALSGTDAGYAATNTIGPAGTDAGYATNTIGPALSGTDVAYAATRPINQQSLACCSLAASIRVRNAVPEYHTL